MSIFLYNLLRFEESSEHLCPVCEIGVLVHFASFVLMKRFVKSSQLPHLLSTKRTRSIVLSDFFLDQTASFF